MKSIKLNIGMLTILLAVSACAKKAEIQSDPPVKDLSSKTLLNLDSSNGVLYTWNFEGSTPLQHLSDTASGVSIVPDPTNSSNSVMKRVLMPGSYRTEASLNTNADNALYFYTNKAAGDPSSQSLGSEGWIGLRVLTNQSSDIEGLGTIKASIVQIGPIRNSYHENWGTAGYGQFRINYPISKWNWKIFGNSPTNSFAPITNDSNVSSITYGQWKRLVFHFNLKSDSTGVIDIYDVDYSTVTPISHIAGANTYDGDYIRIAFGIYLGKDNYPSKPVTCYFDDIKVGGASCSLAAVAP